MKNDERYKPKPQSYQMEFAGLGSQGEKLMREARQWVQDNPDAWLYMVYNAKRLAKYGYVSANYLVNMVRNELRVGVKNGYAPAFSRIMCEEHPDLKDVFRTHSSMTDGFTL